MIHAPMCHPEVPTGTPIPDVRTEGTRVDVTGGSMPALLAFPERTPAPAVLVINDIFGRVSFYETLGRRLATAGYVALVPEYFFREGALPEPTREAATARRAKLDERRTIEDLRAALAWLGKRDDVRGERIGTIGFCMGGTFVLQLAALSDRAVASVSYYGFPAATSAMSDPPAPLDLIDRMRGPILGHWGDQDVGVGIPNVESLRAGLAAKKIDHEFHIYPGLGHGFLKAFLEDERAAGYAQACESWRRTLSFYDRHLGGRSAA